ncbi:uncharacterized protein METZ01_LOCUS280596, partial [marine metagenome]
MMAEPKDFKMKKEYYNAYAAWKNDSLTYAAFMESLPSMSVYLNNKLEFEKHHFEQTQRSRRKLLEELEIRSDRKRQGQATKESKGPKKPSAGKVGKSKSEELPQLGTPDGGNRRIRPSTPTPIVAAVMICSILVYGNIDAPFSDLGNGLIS